VAALRGDGGPTVLAATVVERNVAQLDPQVVAVQLGMPVEITAMGESCPISYDCDCLMTHASV